MNTVQALQQMDLSLQKIKEVLAYDDLEQIIGFLHEAEQKVDEKIAQLQNSKAKIQLAKSTYENKLHIQQYAGDNEIIWFHERVILLSDNLEVPTLDNLWGYLRHFYDQISVSKQGQFAFEDIAGVYTEAGVSRLFAVCTRYVKTDGLKVLPAGKYLCGDCTEENRVGKIAEMLQIVKDKYHAEPQFTVQQVIVSGILQWRYQVQIYIGD